MAQPGWEKQIEAAQWEPRIEFVLRDGTVRVYDRIRYGRESEDWGASERPCHDCRVTEGQFHVPGCDVERCPQCHGQLIGCDCVIWEPLI